ncbi:hypothetical protein HK405_010223, partial [Cladochytrium tenue]
MANAIVVAIASAAAVLLVRPVAADDQFVNASACIDISSTAACAPWTNFVTDLQFPSMINLFAYLGSGVVDAASFDANIYALNYTSAWPKSYGCPNLTVSGAGGAFPVRFAETYACASTIANAVLGSTALGTCITTSQANKLPSMCKETCQTYLKSFATLRSNSAICSSGTGVDALQTAAYDSENSTIADICQGLPSAGSSTSGGSTCISYTLRDFASCGFGNTTAGLKAAQSYCDGLTTKDTCCSYLGQSAAAVDRVLGYGGASGVTSSGTAAATPVLIGTLVGALVVVMAGGAAAFFFYRKKRNNENFGRGGFSDGTEPGTYPLENKGIVVGQNSRLSFIAVPKRAAPAGPGGYAPSGLSQSSGAGPSSLPRKLGPVAGADTLPKQSLARKLGPNASQLSTAHRPWSTQPQESTVASRKCTEPRKTIQRQMVGEKQTTKTGNAPPTKSLEDISNADKVRRGRLKSIQENVANTPPDSFPITIEELGKICNFDRRTNPSQVELLNNQYGGVEGVACLLKSDIHTGLRRAEDGIAPAKEKKPKGKVAPQPELDGSAAEHEKESLAADAAIRLKLFGKNLIPPPRSATIFEIVWDTIKEDPIVKILLV